MKPSLSFSCAPPLQIAAGWLEYRDGTERYHCPTKWDTYPPPPPSLCPALPPSYSKGSRRDHSQQVFFFMLSALQNMGFPKLDTQKYWYIARNKMPSYVVQLITVFQIKKSGNHWLPARYDTHSPPSFLPVCIFGDPPPSFPVWGWDGKSLQEFSARSRIRTTMTHNVIREGRSKWNAIWDSTVSPLPDQEDGF